MYYFEFIIKFNEANKWTGSVLLTQSD